MYEYIVITEHDPILQEYYITKWRKSTIYKEINTVQKLMDAHEQQKRISAVDQEGTGRKELRTIYRWSITLSLRKKALREGSTTYTL